MKPSTFLSLYDKLEKLVRPVPDAPLHALYALTPEEIQLVEDAAK